MYVRKVTGLIALVVVSIAMFTSTAFAHVVVTPNETQVGKWVVFNISVPNEEQVPVSSLKIAIPDGVSNVMPTALAGWEIAIEKADNVDEVTSITWTGSIPVGQRQDFSFNAQVPAKDGEIQWKAYQTYANGKVVSWDQKPSADKGDDKESTNGPYSVTKVVDDLKETSATNEKSSNNSNAALLISLAALVISVAAFARGTRGSHSR